MTTFTSPSDIARETLKALAMRKLVPTPDNYARVYQEISGQPATGVPDGGPKPAVAWPDLIRDLLKQLETPHKGITVTRKKEGVDIVLKKFSGNPEELFEKLRGLMRSWATAPTAANLGELVSQEMQTAVGAALAAVNAAPANPVADSEMVAQLRELLAQTLEGALGAQPELEAAMVTEMQEMIRQAREVNDLAQATKLSKLSRQFWIKLELRGGDKAKIQEGLVRLLRLLVENVGELTTEDKWLHGQIATLQEIISRPMDKRTIADAERNLRDAIIKQHLLRESLTDAKSTLKNLMATFIDRLGELTESTGDYHAKIADYSQKIGGADNLAELSHLLDDIMHDTRVIQDSAQRSHEELLVTRKQAQEAEERVRQLERELAEASEKMHEDQLTGALNRRGMDETLEREINRADRQQSPVSLALLDIDNFKRLNDTLGHQAGDHALVHLTSVIKETLRPTDAVARYGGEEFLIIMPDTGLEDAMATISRLQRELTKKFFLHNNERLLITFSAGVALRNADEGADLVIGRADKAMYHAKQTGKNRVVASE
ncbi:MAG: diguanylate cyclase [Nitrosomonadales bacterium]|nr:diguanylate cyclase [Nitrosomonadales bacterium]